MLIRISDAFLGLVPELLGDEDLREAFDNLALAHRKGVHIVSASIPMLTELARHTVGDAQGAFRLMRMQHHEQAALLRQLDVYIQVEHESGPITATVSGSHQCIHVPLSYFRRISRALHSRLLGEDQSDADIFRATGMAYLRRFRRELVGLQLKIGTYAGGGQNIGTQFTVHMMDAPTLCIVDSDKDHQHGSVGETAKGAHAAYLDNKDKCVAHCHILPCRELENLLPRKCVEDCVLPNDAPEYRARLLAVLDAELFGAEGCLSFVDLKRGLRGYDVFRAVGQHRESLSQVVQALHGSTGACTDEDHKCETAHDCVCEVVRGIGDGMLRRVAKRFNENSSNNVGNYIFSEAASQHWMTLGRLILSWGCAYAPRRV